MDRRYLHKSERPQRAWTAGSAYGSNLYRTREVYYLAGQYSESTHRLHNILHKVAKYKLKPSLTEFLNGCFMRTVRTRTLSSLIFSAVQCSLISHMLKCQVRPPIV
jgi:hypothetical protein